MALFDFGKVTSVTIIPQTPTPLLDSWRMDVTKAVTWSHPGAVSRHPVQSGREGVTDAVRIDPDGLAITGIITDTPIALGAIATRRDRAARMLDLLLRLRAQRTALTVVTSWTPVLKNRWITEITPTRSSATGGAIELTLTIDKLRIVRTQLVPQELDSDIQLLGMSTVTVGEF